MSSDKRRFRFGIRTLLVGTTVVCLLLGLFLKDAARYRTKKNAARSLIESVGGKVTAAGTSWYPTPGNNWLTRVFGLSRNFEELWEVDLSGSSIAGAQAAKLKGCDWIRRLDLSRTQLRDEDLGFLAGLPKLRELKLNDMRITDDAIAHLKLSLIHI